MQKIYKKHIFFCLNQREESKKCCNNDGATELYNYAKKSLPKLQDIRINSAGCLGKCAAGPVLVVYPEGVWYNYNSQEDIEEIFVSHIQNDVPVKRLLLKSES